MQTSEEKIKQLVLPILREEDLELVEIRFLHSGPAWSLRVFVDKSGGVTIDQCASISRRISDRLDTTDIIAHRYVLEVSSPGLDRPLRNREDFERKIGEEVKINLKQEINGTLQIEGRILRLAGDEVILSGRDSQINIALEKIIEAKIII